MSDNITIRKAEIFDGAYIYKFICKLEGENPTEEEFRKVYLKNLSDPDVYYFVAIKDLFPVAFISLQIRHVLHHTSAIGEIMEMFVSSEWRNKGIGEQLYWHVRDIAQENGCKFFEISCNIVRDRASNFFERLGLQKTHYKFTERL